MGRLAVVTGTGTGIGKTHLSVSLLTALGRLGVKAAGVKPVESGVAPSTTAGGQLAPGSDAALLAAASTFHVKHRPVTLAMPISPHRAARLDGVTLDLPALARAVHEARPAVDLLLAELPGGLFTPLTDDALNADLVLRLEPDVVLLVAPDRLGVLHDVLATTRAARACGVRLDGVVLVSPEASDDSTGTNAAELGRVNDVPVLATVPRGPVPVLAGSPEVARIVRAVTTA